jgi:hypothetical protein
MNLEDIINWKTLETAIPPYQPHRHLPFCEAVRKHRHNKRRTYMSTRKLEVLLNSLDLLWQCNRLLKPCTGLLDANIIVSDIQEPHILLPRYDLVSARKDCSLNTSSMFVSHNKTWF